MPLVAHILFYECGPPVPVTATPRLSVVQGAIVERVRQVFGRNGVNAVCCSLWRAAAVCIDGGSDDAPFVRSDHTKCGARLMGYRRKNFHWYN
jgi:hypothetical protein